MEQPDGDEKSVLTSSLDKCWPYLALSGVLTAYNSCSRPAMLFWTSASRSFKDVSGEADPASTKPPGTVSRDSCTTKFLAMGFAKAARTRQETTNALEIILKTMLVDGDVLERTVVQVALALYAAPLCLSHMAAVASQAHILNSCSHQAFRGRRNRSWHLSCRHAQLGRRDVAGVRMSTDRSLGSQFYSGTRSGGSSRHSSGEDAADVSMCMFFPLN